MDGLTLTHKPIPHHTLPNLNRGQDTRANRTRPPRTPRLHRQSFHFVTEDTGPVSAPSTVCLHGTGGLRLAGMANERERERDTGPAPGTHTWQLSPWSSLSLDSLDSSPQE